MNARRARQRRQEQARYHQEQSKLKPDEQDTRFRLQVLRHERAVALAAINFELNTSMSELQAIAAEQRKKVHEEYDQRIKVAAGRERQRKVGKDATEHARRLGIAIPTLDDMKRIGKEQPA